MMIEMATEEAPSNGADVMSADISVSSIKKILLMKLDHIGDFVLGFPAFRRIRYYFPDAEITMLCGSWNEKLALASGLFDRVVCLNLFKENSGENSNGVTLNEPQFAALGLQGFDIAIDFRDASETRFLLDRVGAGFRAGFAASDVHHHMDLSFPSSSFRRQAHHSTLQLLLAASVIAMFENQKQIEEVLKDIADQTPARSLPLSGRGPTIGINVGSGDPEKNWPIEKFARLCDRLIEELDASIVLFGSATQRLDSEQVEKSVSRNITNLAGDISLLEFVSTVGNVDVYIGNDTGTTHISAGLGLPTVCIFSGLTTFESHGVLGDRCVTVQPARGLSVKSIKVEDVLDAIAKVRQPLPGNYLVRTKREIFNGKANFFVIDNKSYETDFRRHLLTASKQYDINVAHLFCSKDTIVSLNDEGTVKYDGRTEPELICDDLLASYGQKKTVVLVGLGLDNTRVRLVKCLRRTFKDIVVLYDVFDYFRYAATGKLFYERLKLDIRWRRKTDQCLLLEQGLSWIYPGSAHLDNASHVRPVEPSPEASVRRVVYIGSIDSRVDFEWLDALAKGNISIDIYGRIHKGDAQIELMLNDLLSRNSNISYFGGYNNDQLEGILKNYRIGILPYKTHDTMTRHINPDKLYHYLNAGLEVIASPIPQVKRLKQYIHIARYPSDTAAALASAQAGRLSASWPASEYTWEKRWTQLARIAGID